MRWLSRGLTVLSAMLLLGLPADGTSIAGKPPAGSGGEWPRADQPPDDLALALRYAPIVHLDRLDPFLPTFAGYTIFRRDGESPSFPRRVTLRPGPLEIDANDARDIAALFPDGRLPEVPEIEAALVIEYAIWWDWDIQHLYESGARLELRRRRRPAALRRGELARQLLPNGLARGHAASG
ncbi:MAG: hypothetical protein M3Q65_17375 [Chloroflexota bacterium]|nr:hypothetical protein [Chloroflexota bacterium]